MMKNFKLFFVSILFSTFFIFGNNANANASANIHVDGFIIKELNNSNKNLSISEDEHKRLVDKLSYDAEKEISNWVTWKIFLGIIPLFLIIVGFIWSSISREIEKRIDKHIDKLEKQREKAIEVTIKATLEIEKTQKALEELQKLENELDKKLKDFQKIFSEEIKNKEDEIIELGNKADSVKNNLDSITDDLESKVTDEIDLVRREIKVIRFLIDKIDKDQVAKSQIIEELILDLKDDDTEKKYVAVELLPQFKTESNRISDIFVEMLKTTSDIAFGSLLLNGLGELDGNKESLKNYLIELAGDLSNPNILAIIGALSSFNDNKEIELE
ncbi:MAG: hypothetical protein WBI40_10070, partial [Methylococcaceae bacterium]